MKSEAILFKDDLTVEVKYILKAQGMTSATSTVCIIHCIYNLHNIKQIFGVTYKQVSTCN